MAEQLENTHIMDAIYEAIGIFLTKYSRSPYRIMLRPDQHAEFVRVYDRAAKRGGYCAYDVQERNSQYYFNGIAIEMMSPFTRALFPDSINMVVVGSASTLNTIKVVEKILLCKIPDLESTSEKEDLAESVLDKSPEKEDLAESLLDKYGI